jgi:uncharacterized membrane protein YhaH (DUF805 family)
MLGLVNAREVSKMLKYVGFACLVVGAFGMGRMLPPEFEITVLGLSVLSFAAIGVLYLRSGTTMTRVPRSTFWTMIGSLFAVALLVGQIVISLPSNSADKYATAMVLLMAGPMLPVVIAAVIVQIRRWHDLNASGWWILINAIPYLGYLATIIVCGFIPGTRGPNRFGPDPLGRVVPVPAPVRPAQDPTRSVARSLDWSGEQRASKPPPIPSMASSRPEASSLEKELRSLAALKADGIISEEEFNAKKRALLGL